MLVEFEAKRVKDVITKVQEVKKKKGTFFSAVNRKKDGDRRVWNCKLKVIKHLKGVGPRYSAEEKNFITVWDPNAKGDRKYRQLDVSTLEYLKVCGEVLVEEAIPTAKYFRYLSMTVDGMRGRTRRQRTKG